MASIRHIDGHDRIPFHVQGSFHMSASCNSSLHRHVLRLPCVPDRLSKKLLFFVAALIATSHRQAFLSRVRLASVRPSGANPSAETSSANPGSAPRRARRLAGAAGSTLGANVLRHRTDRGILNIHIRPRYPEHSRPSQYFAAI